MNEPRQLPPHLIGGNFLLTDANPSDVFTPEDLTVEQRMMAEAAEKFMEKEVLPHIERLEHQEEGFALRLMREAAGLGFLGIEIPEKYGGFGLGKTSTCAVEGQLSRYAGFGLSCSVHTGIGSQPITYFGSDDQKARYLPKIASGEWIAAYALTEADSGSDALAMKCKAARSDDGKHYILNGTKMWITNAGWADLFIVFAKVDGKDVTAFIVEKAFAGVSTGKEEHKLGIKGSSTRRVVLEDVHVPVENVLGEAGKGHYIALNILNMGRFKIGMGCIAAARQSLKDATRYALERHQFGKPIASFGLIQHKLAEMTVQIFAGESMVFRTAKMIEDVLEAGDMLGTMNPPYPRGIEEFALECSAVKIACSEILDFVVDEAVQIHGGFGYSEEFPAARAYRDSRINRIFEGTNEINRLFIPSSLMRRAQRAQFPLFEAIDRLSHDPAEGEITPLALVGNSKKLVLLLISLLCQKFGDSWTREQEVSACLSDVVMDVYAMESALLRTLKHPASTIMPELTNIFVNDAAARIGSNARTIIAAVAEVKAMREHLETARRLLRWNPVNTVSMRQKIAGLLCETGSYSTLLSSK